MLDRSQRPSKARDHGGVGRARARHVHSVIFLAGFVSLATAATARASSSAPLSAAQVLQFLDQTIDGYRGLTLQQQLASMPTDLAILFDNRHAATQTIRLAFDFARAQAALFADDRTASQRQSAVLSQYPSLGRLQVRLDKRVKDTQAELDSDQQKRATAGVKNPQALQSQISELQDELDRAGARRDAVHSMLEFKSLEQDPKAQLAGDAAAIRLTTQPSAGEAKSYRPSKRPSGCRIIDA